MTRLSTALRSFAARAAAVRRLRRTERVRPASREWCAPGSNLLLGTLAALLFLLPPLSVRAAQHGEAIVNTAVFTSSSQPPVTTSVTVKYIVRTPSTLQFLKFAPTSAAAELLPVGVTAYRTGETQDSPFASLSAPLQVPSGEPIEIAAAVSLATSAVFHGGEAVFLRLADPDQNLDPAVAETVLITVTAGGTGDREVLRLTETGPDTGIFTGYLQSAPEGGTPFDGRLTVQEAGTVTARYVDIRNDGDISTSTTLFDPFGVVFDSRTGLPVNGAQVTLVDADSGEAATVFGDNGVSRFPATIVTGETATDSDGNIYSFRPGAFRFPFVPPGRYRLDIVPPAGFAAPSTVADADLQDLPGSPYALGPGSRGQIFVLDPGPALRIDIPLDPVATGGVWLSKTAGKDRAAIGDFLPYRVEIENPNAAPTAPLTLTDRLPVGFRYREGSARLDGVRIEDPQISADGRTLAFSLAGQGPESRRELRYVTEISAGARAGKAVNTATATTSAGIRSNSAQATVLVQDDFFRNTTFLLGRVLTGGCEESEGKNDGGLPGVRIYLEDGTYVVTDDEGMYHFEGVRPGVHVVQLDLDSLPPQYEVLPCEKNSRFAGRAFSQFVDLQGGTLWRSDFHVGLRPKPRGEVAIEMNGALADDLAFFRIPVRIGTVPLRNLRVSVILPEGAAYLPGSATLADAPTADPEGAEGTLLFRLEDAAPGAATELAFRCRLAEGAPGELAARIQLLFDSPDGRDQRTPVAENRLERTVARSRQAIPEFTLRPHFPTLGADLSAEDRVELDRLAEQLKGVEILRLFTIGHTDNVRIAPRNRHLYADNFSLSEARARSVGRYLAETLHLPPAKIVLVGLGDAVPVADNSTPEGRALNRRVEVRVECEKIAEQTAVKLVKERSGVQKTETVGLRPGDIWPEEEKRAQKTTEETAAGILSPGDGTVLANRISAVRVRLDGRLKPRLLLDDKEIPADRIGFRMEDKESRLNLYSYIGVDFGAPGEHRLTLQGIDPFGNARFQQTVTIIRTGEISAIRVLETGENLADGLTPITVRVALLDRAGKVIRAPAELEILAGDLQPPQKNSRRNADALPEASGKLVSVDANGLVRFAPVQTGGLYRVVLGHNEAKVELETYIQPKLRDWILVGLAEGTVGYNAVTGNVENLPAGAEEDLYEDGRLAFYAKGKVLGKWLLTMAYDSDKPDRKGRELLQTIDPDSYYTLYGDASQQAYDAASAEKVYLKVERGQFYALFGDYTTGLSQTELSRYRRSLTGLKSEFHSRYFSVNLFASDTDQAFVKDEIRGDGTSGLYRLSRRDLVLNSEKVRIEVRDRLRSEVIVSSQDLARHVDYNIDYQAGTLFFKAPVPSRDESFNPVFIVIDYETATTANSSLNYGGRAAVRLPATRVEVGVTAIHEEVDGAEGDLYGVDAVWALTEATRLRAELAASDSQLAAGGRDGSAWLAELEHRSSVFAGKAYLRQLEEGFGLGQQRGSEEGTRKFGVDGAYRLGEKLNLGGQLYRQENLETEAVRDVAQADLTYAAGRYTLSTGLRQAVDDFADGGKETSTQALLGATWEATDRLLLRAAREQSIAGKNGSGDFPTRTLLGADYKLTAAATLFAAQEFTHGDDVKTSGTRLGLKTTPWSGGRVDTALEQQTGEYGPRMFALFGLGQSLKLNERWSVDGSLDRSHTIRQPDADDFDPDVPPASGEQEDFTAVSLGLTRKSEKWSWANRVEFRDGETEDKWGVFSGLVGEVHRGLGISARTQVFVTDGARTEKTDGEVRLGLAYRPFASRWIVLDRLDFRFDEEKSGTADLRSWRLVNNLNANYRPDRRTQVSLQYGAKFVRENIDGDRYDGFTDLVGVEGRYDITERWDFGLRGSVLHSWRSGTVDYSSGLSVGCNVATNAWLSLGYNFTGFEDEDFSRADFTAQGPFLKFRLKFDQSSAREAVAWLHQL